MIDTVDRIKTLEQLYTFTRPEQVAHYLQTYPLLVPTLLEAHERLLRLFGPVQVRLEVVKEPEAPGYTTLFGYIVTSLAPDEAGKRLQQFDRSWFLQQMSRLQGRLNFDVEWA